MPLDRVPDLASLRLLRAVAERGSIGAAARDRGTTQQAASDRLRGMESQVGVTLVRRSRRGSSLTEAGTLLVGWSARLLDAADEVGEAVATLRADHVARLRVAASMTVAEYLLPRWLLVLRGQAASAGRTPPAVELVATNSRHVLAALAAGTADLGFVEGTEAPSTLRWRDLARDELVVVVAPGHPWTRRRRPVTAVELARAPLVAREQGSGTRDVFELALTRLGVPAPEPAVELTTTTAVRETVRGGAGAAVLSRLAVLDDVEAGRLVVVPVPDLDLGRRLRAVWAGPVRPPAGPARDLLDVALATHPR